VYAVSIDGRRFDMRKFGAAALATGTFMIMAGPAQAQVPLERHYHGLKTPNRERHVIAAGLTENAPCHAFRTFHETVHLGVFVFGSHPLNVTAQGTGVNCP
jgi:hypothetical protein